MPKPTSRIQTPVRRKSPCSASCASSPSIPCLSTADRHGRDQPGHPPGALGGGPRARAGRRVPRGRRLRPGERVLLRAGRPQRPHLLAQDGLAPSEGEPAVPPADGLRGGDDHHPPFRAGPRPPGRSGRRAGRRTTRARATDGEFVRRLRIYPHALREANAYYSPQKKALLFGYFPASADDPAAQPAGRHGVHLPVARHRRPRDDPRPARRHAPALHRAEQPGRPGVPRGVRRRRRPVPALLASRRCSAHQIARTRGDLASQNLLGQLAQQFGQAIGSHGALRDAIGEVEPADGQVAAAGARPGRPAATTASRTPAGAILVAAVFDAFLTIYKSRVARPAAHRHRRHRRAARRATSTPTWSTGWPARRPSRPATSSPCASAPSTTARRWT